MASDPEEPIVIDIFEQRLNSLAKQFVAWYKAEKESADQTGDDWPLEMSEYDWWDQFDAYLERGDYQI